jgi:glycine/D-amino acid oxidase-like deaminating enzyme
MYADRTDDLKPFGLNGFSTMVGNTAEGGLHSGKLVMALQQLVRQMGAIYLEGHMVETSHHEESHNRMVVKAHSEQVITIQAPVLIWATNARLGKLPELEDEIKPARGQVLLSPPVTGLTLRGTFHFDEGFYYFRNLGNRLLLGGARNMAFEEEQTFQDQPSDFIGGVLSDFVRKHFPQVAPLLPEDGWMHWAGIMGMSKSKKPFVREIASGQWAVLACNGMGVALTPMVAETIADKVIQSQV